MSTAPTQNRRVKSTSSGFGPSSAAGIPIGSSAIPQIGQSPGPSRTISGCIGQVYFVPGGTLSTGALAGSRYLAGSAANLSWHLCEQKW